MDKDYNKYVKTVQEYKKSINGEIIETAINNVVGFVRDYDHDKNELLDFHNEQKILGSESYKYDVYEKANEALRLENWNTSAIGSGLICNYVIDAMAYTDNLVNRHYTVPEFLNLLKTSDKKKRDKYELALFGIYFGDDEEKAFNDAICCFSGKYPLLAYLFFIKDRHRFLPTSPETFDDIFGEMGLPFKMKKRCAWNNYCEFISIISCVQDYLVKTGLCSHEVSLLDAHSAVWIMNYVEYKSWRSTTIDINTPLRPKNRIRKPDGNINYICARCSSSFIKSSRCPECGQLVKE